MKLRHLRYFIVVAEEMSFAKASVRLRIEATPLSRATRDLEHEVGVDLLARAKGRVRLTPADQAFHDSCRRMLDLYDEARKHAHSVANGSRSRLRIDAGITVDGDVVSGFIKEPIWSERPIAAIPSTIRCFRSKGCRWPMCCAIRWCFAIPSNARVATSCS